MDICGATGCLHLDIKIKVKLQGVYIRILGYRWSYRMSTLGYLDTGGATGCLHQDTRIQVKLQGVYIRILGYWWSYRVSTLGY